VKSSVSVRREAVLPPSTGRLLTTTTAPVPIATYAVNRSTGRLDVHPRGPGCHWRFRSGDKEDSNSTLIPSQEAGGNMVGGFVWRELQYAVPCRSINDRGDNLPMLLTAIVRLPQLNSCARGKIRTWDIYDEALAAALAAEAHNLEYAPRRNKAP